MTRKTTDDPAARQDFTTTLIDRVLPASEAPLVVDLFKTVEYETATPKVGGETVEMRRVVLTGPWEPVRK